MKFISSIVLLGSVASASIVNYQNSFNSNPNEVLPNKLPHNVVPKVIQKLQKRDSHMQVNNSNSKSMVSHEVLVADSNYVPQYCRADTHYIQTSNDLFVLQQNCDEVYGDVVLNSVNFDSSIVNFGKLKKINGDITIENCEDIIRISAQNLKYITGDFHLTSLTSLVSVEFPVLESATSLVWKVLPILNSVSLNQDVLIDQNIIISDTSISNIDGFTKIKEIEIFNINNNRFLETIKSNIEVVNTQFSVHANAKELELEMAQLRSVRNITVRDTSLVYFPKLETVSSSLEFIENLFTSLEIPTLKQVGGTLGIIDNSNLINVDLNNITEIQGGLMISNNRYLESIDFFQSLKQIGGAIHFEGKFKEASFDNLKLVKGSAYIKSSSEAMDCGRWIAPKNGRSIIRGGKIKCTSAKKQSFLSVDENGSILENKEHESDFYDDDNEYDFDADESRSADNKSAKKPKKGLLKLTNNSNKQQIFATESIIIISFLIIAIINCFF